MGFTGLRLLGVGGCSCIGKGSSWRDILSIETCLLDKTFEEPLYRGQSSSELQDFVAMKAYDSVHMYRVYKVYILSLSHYRYIYIYVQRYIENRIESYWPPVYSIISSLSLWLVWEPHIFFALLFLQAHGSVQHGSLGEDRILYQQTWLHCPPSQCDRKLCISDIGRGTTILAPFPMFPILFHHV